MNTICCVLWERDMRAKYRSYESGHSHRRTVLLSLAKCVTFLPCWADNRAEIRTPTIHSGLHIIASLFFRYKKLQPLWEVNIDHSSETIHDGYLDVCALVDLLLSTSRDWPARYHGLNPVRINLQIRGELWAAVHLQHPMVPLYLGHSRYHHHHNTFSVS